MGIRKLNSAGDTIVEVLLAVAIISFVVGTGFAITGRSTNSLRTSQERAEAQKIAETQLEYIVQRSALGSDDACFDINGEPSKASSGKCNFSSGGGTSCNIADQSFCYGVVVERLRTETAGSTVSRVAVVYNVIVSWVGPDGNDDEVTVAYKTYIDNPAFVAAAGSPGGALEIEVGAGGGGGGGGSPGGGGGGGGGPAPTSGTFRYGRTFTFLLLRGVTQAEVASCTWNFGDGTVQTFAASSPRCQQGGTISHTFPENPAYPAGAACTFGGGWTRTDYRVLLSVRTFAGATVISNDVTVSLPYCAS